MGVQNGTFRLSARHPSGSGVPALYSPALGLQEDPRGVAQPDAQSFTKAGAESFLLFRCNVCVAKIDDLPIRERAEDGIPRHIIQWAVKIDALYFGVFRRQSWFRDVLPQ